MTHLYRDDQYLVEREEYRNLDQHRQAAGERVHLLAFVQIHHLLLLAELVVGKALAQALDFGLQLFHLAHRAVGSIGEREEQKLDRDGEKQDGESEIPEIPVEEIEKPKDRLGQEDEPAPVDRQVEAFDSERVLIVPDGADDLCARKKMLRQLDRAAGRDGAAIEAIIGLEGLGAVERGGAVGAFERLILGRNCRRHPVLVGNANPSAGGLKRYRGFVVLEVVIFRVFQRAVRGAHKTFMQHPKTLRRRNAIARNICVGIKLDRGGGFVGHAVGDGEHVLIVDGNGARKSETLTVVPAKGYGTAGRQRVSV